MRRRPAVTARPSRIVGTLVRVAVFALLIVVTLGGLACRGGRERAAAANPVERLSTLLRQGARPGELTADERAEAERLLLGMLPALSGPLAGYRWRVAYDDLPQADFVSVDLLQGDGEAAPRAMWFHLFWRGTLPASEQAAWALRLGRWPARGVEGHHLFVRLGGLELRAVADAPEYRDAGRMRSVLERFDLDAFAQL
ncbi:MAG TPA: hypothetical protein VN811_09035 [Thermoanaerobaculia bacterium]|nr:hypothetical protein [Thermoanaerobaculia bacterium]